ncbi:hypothetical protein LY78DRAFT_173715 [Colletotrichum sublineola]|nr:hypothetical protein LY78DRAFT_173715 [Colletotrichum sublineola]
MICRGGSISLSPISPWLGPPLPLGLWSAAAPHTHMLTTHSAVVQVSVLIRLCRRVNLAINQMRTLRDTGALVGQLSLDAPKAGFKTKNGSWATVTQPEADWRRVGAIHGEPPPSKANKPPIVISPLEASGAASPCLTRAILSPQHLRSLLQNIITPDDIDRSSRTSSSCWPGISAPGATFTPLLGHHWTSARLPLFPPQASPLISSKQPRLDYPLIPVSMPTRPPTRTGRFLPRAEREPIVQLVGTEISTSRTNRRAVSLYHPFPPCRAR